MKQKNTIKSMTAGAMAFLLCVLAVMPAFGFGVMAVPGALAYGTAPQNENSVIAVESLDVTVDVRSLDDVFYKNEQGIWDHCAVVTSRYTLRNPTDMTVTETMAIPFGALPNYDHDRDYEDPVLPQKGAYSIIFKGQEITPAVHHGFSEESVRNTSIYEPLDDSAWSSLYPMGDEKMTDTIYYPLQKVTAYTYVVSNPEHIDFTEFTLYTQKLWEVDTDKTRIYCDKGGEQKGKLYVYASDDGEAFTVYVIGQDAVELTWQALSGEEEVAGITATLQSRVEMTYEELAMQYYTPECGASEVDWYNAVYAFMQNGYREAYADNGILSHFRATHDITDHLQGWLIYEITLSPGESAELVTKTPAFPDIMNWYKPYVYEYGYDQAGLLRFASVDSFTFTVNTEGCILDESSYYSKYRVPAGEYSLSIETVEENPVLFTVCSKSEPFDWIDDTWNIGLGVMILVGFLMLVLLGVVFGGALTLLIIVIKKNKSKKTTKRS